MDLKKCSGCRMIKTVDNFETNEKVFKTCKWCRNYQKVNAEQIKTNLDKRMGCENSRRYYRLNKEEIEQKILITSKLI